MPKREAAAQPCSPLVRPLVRALRPYVPGEQPQVKGLIKLNTNENPYPPSPRVLEAVKAAVDGRLRLYPNPTADALREKLARLHGCRVENLIVGNGSDELLALAVRAFVEPRLGLPAGACRFRTMSARSANTVQTLVPSYSLYPVLAAMHGACHNAVGLGLDFHLPTNADLKLGCQWDARAALTFITTPNAPTGRGHPTAALDRLCRATRGVVVLDEAYADFAGENALALALRLPNVIVSRTFSKAYSLCFQRVGYFVGPAPLIGALHKIRDSYNVNGLGQVAAETTLDDLPYYRANFRRILATREETSRGLRELGFVVLPSDTNFLLARPPRRTAQEWLDRLREHKVLVRWLDLPAIKEYLRVSIGSDGDMEGLLTAAKRIAAEG